MRLRQSAANRKEDLATIDSAVFTIGANAVGDLGARRALLSGGFLGNDDLALVSPRQVLVNPSQHHYWARNILGCTLPHGLPKTPILLQPKGPHRDIVALRLLDGISAEVLHGCLHTFT